MAADFRLRWDKLLLLLVSFAYTEAFYIPGMSDHVPPVVLC